MTSLLPDGDQVRCRRVKVAARDIKKALTAGSVA